METNQNGSDVRNQSEKTHEVDGKKFNVPINEQKNFEPKKINLDELSAGLNEDPGKFKEAILGFGLLAGQIVSLMFKNENGYKSFLRTKVDDIKEDGLSVRGKGDVVSLIPFAKIAVLEVLQRGQRFASDELYYPFMGKNIEEMKPVLGLLLSGNEVYLTGLQMKIGESVAEAGKVSLDRDEKGQVKANFIPREEKLKMPEKVLNVELNELQFNQIKNGGLRVDFDFVNKQGERVQMKGLIFVDSKLNKVRYKFLSDEQAQKESVKQSNSEKVETQNESQGEKIKSQNESPYSALLATVKELKQSGFPDAWVNLKTDNKEIVLEKASGVSITFEDPKTLKGAVLSGPFVDNHKAALDIVKTAEVKLGEKRMDALTIDEIINSLKLGKLSKGQVELYAKNLLGEEQRLLLDASYSDDSQTRKREEITARAIGDRGRVIQKGISELPEKQSIAENKKPTVKQKVG